MILRQRCEHPNPVQPAWLHCTAANDRDRGFAGLVPATRFEEMLVCALTAATTAAAAPERTPPLSSLRRPAVYYIDVDRFELAAAGLTEDAIESALSETGRRLNAWAGRSGAVTRRGADHFVLIRYGGGQTAGADDSGELDLEASDHAAADLRRHLHRPMLVAGRRVRVAASVEVVHPVRGAG